MKAEKQELVNHLWEALHPQVSRTLPADTPRPKGLVKLVGQLADYILRLRAKQAQPGPGIALTYPEKGKRQLTDELAVVLTGCFTDTSQEETANDWGALSLQPAQPRGGAA